MAASDSPEDVSAADVAHVQLPESPKSHVMTYRPRSPTYLWVESEAEEEATLGNSPYQYPVDELANLTIGPPPTPYTPLKSKSSTQLRAEAREFTPLALPSPIGSVNSRVSSQGDYEAEIPRTTLNMITLGPPITPSCRSSLANQLILSSGHLNSPLSSLISLPAALPATPSPVRIRQPTHIDPRTYGGPARLSIYNDQLSPSHQPQTPADLARRPILIERDTAYTAPPGSIGRCLRIVSTESPTMRGRELRARRTREYQRAEAVERERANEQRAERALWLDEWAADRVGEENS